MFAEFLIFFFIHWRKHSNGHSIFSGFILRKTKMPNPADDNNKRWSGSVSVHSIAIYYAVRYTKTLVDLIFGWYHVYCVTRHQLLPSPSPRAIISVSGNNELAIILIAVNTVIASKFPLIWLELITINEICFVYICEITELKNLNQLPQARKMSDKVFVS